MARWQMGQTHRGPFESSLCPFCSKNRRRVWGGHCCSRGWQEHQTVEEILCQTRLRLELFQDGLHNPSLNVKDRLVEQLQKERSLVTELLKLRDEVRFGTRMRIEGPSVEVSSPARSFVTDTTCVEDSDTALTLKSKEEKKGFATESTKHSGKHGLVPEPGDDLNWSSQGDHVETEPSEETQIPLETEPKIGCGIAPIVKSTVCKKIRHARKTILRRTFPRCIDTAKEAKHLQDLRHAHLIHFERTYILQSNYTILSHPVSEYTLTEFLPSLCFKNIPFLKNNPTSDPSLRPRLLARLSLLSFFGCLANVLHFIHSHSIVHMDITPQNILVKKRFDLDLIHPLYKVYIVDFDIPRSQKPASAAGMSTQIGFPSAYAAPELLSSRKSGFPADVFSLGCVFAEMLSTMEVWDAIFPGELKRLMQNLKTQPTGRSSYAANAETVQRRLASLRRFKDDDEMAGIIHLTVRMLDRNPVRRLSSEQLASLILVNGGDLHLERCCCDVGPDAFEVVEDDDATTAGEGQYRDTFNRAVCEDISDTACTVQSEVGPGSGKCAPRRVMSRLSGLFTTS